MHVQSTPRSGSNKKGNQLVQISTRGGLKKYKTKKNEPALIYTFHLTFFNVQFLF